MFATLLGVIFISLSNAGISGLNIKNAGGLGLTVGPGNGLGRGSTNLIGPDPEVDAKRDYQRGINDIDINQNQFIKDTNKGSDTYYLIKISPTLAHVFIAFVLLFIVMCILSFLYICFHGSPSKKHKYSKVARIVSSDEDMEHLKEIPI